MSEEIYATLDTVLGVSKQSSISASQRNFLEEIPNFHYLETLDTKE